MCIRDRHLLKLFAQIAEIELALAHLIGRAHCLLGVDIGGGFLHQRYDVAHAENAAGDARRVEFLQRVELLAGADQLDWLVGHRAHGQRGAAALSMRAVTNKPIKLIGTGEKLDALEEFDPARVAGRILGMGDIVSLVEKAAANIDAEKAMRAADKMRKGKFDLGDLREQLQQMQGMGGMSGLLGMMPGVAKMKNQIANAGLDDKLVKRQMAIIDSMTPQERRNPDILKASRKKRIAAGSGTTPEAINKLLKMHRGMSDMMKAMGSGKRGPLAGLGQMMGFGSAMPTPEQMAEFAKRMPPGAQLPPGMPGLPPTMPKLPPNMPGLPGLGGKFPGLPSGLPGLGKKK